MPRCWRVSHPVSPPARPLESPLYDILSNMRFHDNGFVAVYPPPAHLVAATEHNSTFLFLLKLPIELRIEIYKLVLANKEVYIDTLEIVEVGKHPRPYAEDFNFLLTCRQIYSEAAEVPYSSNDFVFTCRFNRDNWVAYRNKGQLSAIRTVGINHAYIFDAINMTDLGGCCHWPHRSDQCIGASHLTMPFSILFPNLRRIEILGSADGLNNYTRECLEQCAQAVGIKEWIDFVKMKEKDEIEVVERPALF